MEKKKKNHHDTADFNLLHLVLVCCRTEPPLYWAEEAVALAHVRVLSAVGNVAARKFLV